MAVLLTFSLYRGLGRQECVDTGTQVAAPLLFRFYRGRTP